MPPKCDPDIYQNGKGVFMEDGTVPAEQFEAWVVCVAALSGEPVDWFYCGGRAVVKTTGDMSTVAGAIADLGYVLKAMRNAEIKRSGTNAFHDPNEPVGKFLNEELLT